MLDRQHLKESLIPYRLVRFNPTYESQVLITNRKMTKLHIKLNKNSFKKSPTNTSNNSRSESKISVFNSPDTTMNFRSAELPTTTPKHESNVKLLKGLS